MRERTKSDKKISKKKHFEAGDIVKIHVFKHTNHKTYEEEEKDIYLTILEKTHHFDGKGGTFYKTINIEEGTIIEETYLHDIPETEATVELVKKAKDES